MSPGTKRGPGEAGRRAPAATPPTRPSVSLCRLQAYIYLNEGERLLRTLKKDKSWSHTFESATFHSLKGEVRSHWKHEHVFFVPGALRRSGTGQPCTSRPVLALLTPPRLRLPARSPLTLWLASLRNAFLTDRGG